MAWGLSRKRKGVFSKSAQWKKLGNTFPGLNCCDEDGDAFNCSGTFSMGYRSFRTGVGGINPRPNGMWQERRHNGRGQRLSMIFVKQLIVKSTTSPILLHCDVIVNIQHLSITRSNHQSSLKFLLHTIFNIFAWNFARLILIIFSMKCVTRKILIYSDTFSKISVFVTVSLIIQLKKYLMYFWMDPQKHKDFSILSKTFRNYAASGTFWNNVAETRAEYIGRQFLHPCSSSPYWEDVCVCVCAGGGGVSAPLTIYVMSTQALKHLKHFKLSITIFLSGFILV